MKISLIIFLLIHTFLLSSNTCVTSFHPNPTAFVKYLLENNYLSVTDFESFLNGKFSLTALINANQGINMTRKEAILNGLSKIDIDLESPELWPLLDQEKKQNQRRESNQEETKFIINPHLIGNAKEISLQKYRQEKSKANNLPNLVVTATKDRNTEPGASDHVNSSFVHLKLEGKNQYQTIANIQWYHMWGVREDAFSFLINGKQYVLYSHLPSFLSKAKRYALTWFELDPHHEQAIDINNTSDLMIYQRDEIQVSSVASFSFQNKNYILLITHQGQIIILDAQERKIFSVSKKLIPLHENHSGFIKMIQKGQQIKAKLYYSFSLDYFELEIALVHQPE